MERTDKALLAAFLAAAALGTLTWCLLVNDASIFIAAGWLGDSWDLYFSQFAGRALGMYLLFGPAQLVLRVVPMSAGTFVTLSHILYFAVPLVLWLALRAIEPHRLFSRLYLAIVLAVVFFPTELIVGCGLWLIWLAIATDQRRSLRATALATIVLGAALIFTHPAIAAMGLLYLVVGTGLRFFGRAVPTQSLIAATILSALLIVGYLAAGRLLPPTNPSVIEGVSRNSTSYIDPIEMAKTVGKYAVIGVLWLLLLGPGLIGRFRPASLVFLAIAGIWFAAAGTNLLTYFYARYTAPHVLALAVVLAIATPDKWLENARRGLILYAAITATAAASYAVDLRLFERFMTRHLQPGIANVETLSTDPWPSSLVKVTPLRDVFKWGAGDDYVRNVIVPTYDWFYRVTLAYHSFFASDRQSVLYHPLDRPGDWRPCSRSAVQHALVHARDAADRRFLTFLEANYCAR
jgi:hypothetical protein